MEALRDRALAEMVLQRIIEDDRIDGEPIVVNASEGIVELNGSVKTEEQADLVMMIADGVPGVRYVVSRLEIRSP